MLLWFSDHRCYDLWAFREKCMVFLDVCLLLLWRVGWHRWPVCRVDGQLGVTVVVPDGHPWPAT